MSLTESKSVGRLWANYLLYEETRNALLLAVGMNESESEHKSNDAGAREATPLLRSAPCGGDIY